MLPPGGFNPPATEGVPTACRIDFQLFLPITAGQSRHSFEQFAQKFFFPYPFLPPAAWGSPEPSVKFALSASCWPILVDFLSNVLVAKCLPPSHTQKNAKIMDFGLPKPPQNPPKIHPKSRSQKTCDFSSIFARILLLAARANIKKTCAHAVFC